MCTHLTGLIISFPCLCRMYNTIHFKWIHFKQNHFSEPSTTECKAAMIKQRGNTLKLYSLDAIVVVAKRFSRSMYVATVQQARFTIIVVLFVCVHTLFSTRKDHGDHTEALSGQHRLLLHCISSDVSSNWANTKRRLQETNRHSQCHINLLSLLVHTCSLELKPSDLRVNVMLGLLRRASN